MSRLVILVSKVKRKRAVAKASPNRANQLAGIDAQNYAASDGDKSVQMSLGC